MPALRTLLLTVVLAPLLLRPPLAGGQEDDAEARLGEALETILTRLARTKEGLRVGIPEKEARRLTSGAADLTGDRILPLAATQYAPKGEWQGTVRVFLSGERGAKVDSIQVCLLCGTYDEAGMARRLVGIGKKLGYEFEVDDEEPNTWWDPAAGTCDLWVSFGKGLIAIDADLVDR